MITAIVGHNASGKTQWVERLRRRIASDRLRYVAFRDSYGPLVDSAYYLQLRWNQHDIDAETPTPAQLLQHSAPNGFPDGLVRRFSLTGVMDKPVIALSSGELRKFQLVKTLAQQPHLLILDNPFIGLDAETRQQLRELLLQIAIEDHIDLYLVLAKSDDIPDYVEKVLDMDSRQPDPEPMTLCQYLQQREPVPPHVLTDEKRHELLTLPHRQNDYAATEVIRMNHVSIRYAERTILSDLSWRVMNGERWAVSGRNGSGKSTLLSLVCADNPQSYACDIALFGYQRGRSGESIWDIKRHIGYVSPEMHRSYHRDIKALHIVASGLKDTIGLYQHPTADEQQQCRFWMHLLGIDQLADRSFLQLSSGEQRLVLLARAFVKDPELLILDEPLHGLDNHNRRLVKDIIETFCERPNKTLIMVTHYEEELPQCITHHLNLARN